MEDARRKELRAKIKENFTSAEWMVASTLASFLKNSETEEEYRTKVHELSVKVAKFAKA
jgi:putative AlgH/UPF0301 family transcriptional regulator